MAIEWLKTNTTDSTPKIKINARELLGMNKSNDSNYILNDLATERVNAFDWKKITSNSTIFNEWLKIPKNWMKLYEAAKNSLMFDDKAIHVIKNNDALSVNTVRYFNSKYDVINEEIKEISVEYHKFEFSKSPYSIVATYKKDAKPSFGYIGNEISNSELIKEFEDRAKSYKVDVQKNKIPVVILYCLPDKKTFYQWSENDAKELDLIKDALTDQILNNMQKLKRIDSSDSAGIDTSSNDLDHYTELSSHDGLSEDGQNKASQMLYSPSETLTRFRDTYDWFEQKIRAHGKSIKDDDNDSAQKNETEIWSINRTATDMLEINRDCFQEWISELIKIMHELKSDKTFEESQIEVDLPFKTITKAILKIAEESGEEKNVS